jgi:hypothetical protein
MLFQMFLKKDNAEQPSVSTLNMVISQCDIILKQSISELLNKKEIKTAKYGKTGLVLMEQLQQKQALHP